MSFASLRCFTSLKSHTLWEHGRSPRYAYDTLCARHALRPRRNLRILACRLRIAACCGRLPHRLPLHNVTRLNHFTLSHCGSRTSLATLKPHLTVLAPSLSTGCLPGFAGQGVAPCYIISAELAHNRSNCLVQLPVPAVCLRTLWRPKPQFISFPQGTSGYHPRGSVKSG